jgi:hypothetical protein
MNKAIMLLNDVLIEIQAGQADWDSTFDRLMVVKTSLEDWKKQFEKELKLASNIVDDLLKGYKK